jgi:hypothetical protein
MEGEGGTPLGLELGNILERADLWELKVLFFVNFLFVCNFSRKI